MKTAQSTHPRRPETDPRSSPSSVGRPIARGMSRWLLLLACAFVICPALGILAALALSATGPLAVAALVGVPAALTYFVGVRLRLGDRIAIVFAVLSPVAVGGVIFALILYAASQGAFE